MKEHLKDNTCRIVPVKQTQHVWYLRITNKNKLFSFFYCYTKPKGKGGRTWDVLLPNLNPLPARLVSLAEQSPLLILTYVKTKPGYYKDPLTYKLAFSETCFQPLG